MIVERYSFDGFKPQKQTYHYKENVEFHLINWDYTRSQYLQYGNRFMYWFDNKHKELLPFYKKNKDDFKEGIWVFKKGYKRRMSLNHLSKPTPRHYAELPDDTIVYDVNWEYQMRLDDPRVEAFGCYIPKRNLSAIKIIS